MPAAGLRLTRIPVSHFASPGLALPSDIHNPLLQISRSNKVQRPPGAIRLQQSMIGQAEEVRPRCLVGGAVRALVRVDAVGLVRMFQGVSEQRDLAMVKLVAQRG